MIIGDSQISFLMPVLEQYFTDVEFFYWDHIGAAGGLPDAADVDQLIVQSVETAAGSRFSNPQLSRVIDQVAANTGAT